MLRKTKKEKIDPKKPDLKHYNILRHQAWIIAEIIIVAILVVFSLPWIIAAVDFLFRKIPYWYDASIEDSSGYFSLSVLPDFLGGTVGIITGFIFEWLFFKKLKLLQQYKSLIICLDNEFGRIADALDMFCKDNEFSTLQTYILDDIISVADNNFVFYNLPRYFPFFEKFEKKGEIYNLILEVYYCINRYNSLIEVNNIDDLYDNLYYYVFLIRKDINSFYKVTKLKGAKSKEIFAAYCYPICEKKEYKNDLSKKEEKVKDNLKTCGAFVDNSSLQIPESMEAAYKSIVFEYNVPINKEKNDFDKIEFIICLHNKKNYKYDLTVKGSLYDIDVSSCKDTDKLFCVKLKDNSTKDYKIEITKRIQVNSVDTIDNDNILIIIKHSG